MADQAKTDKKAPPVRRERIIAVHGDMPHQFVPGTVFTTGNSKLVEWDNWIEVQVDAGKLAISAE